MSLEPVPDRQGVELGTQPRGPAGSGSAVRSRPRRSQSWCGNGDGDGDPGPPAPPAPARNSPGSSDRFIGSNLC
eukprot:766527-Hanusia_phi.AAC.10